MTSQRAAVWGRVLFVVVMTPVLFVILQGPARSFELRADVEVLRLLQVHHIVMVSGPDALIAPMHSASWFWIDVSPSCSSLASLLTLGCIALVLPRHLAPARRRALAVGGAVLAVFVGNMIRIDASIFAGVLAGRASLVLFHDWVGSIFGFGYTMGGFILMLYLLLPARSPGGAVASTTTASSYAAPDETREAAGLVGTGSRPAAAVSQ